MSTTHVPSQILAIPEIKHFPSKGLLFLMTHQICRPSTGTGLTLPFLVGFNLMITFLKLDFSKERERLKSHKKKGTGHQEP